MKLIQSVSNAVEPVAPSPAVISQASTFNTIAPLLSVVIEDFLKRYDHQNKAMLGKLSATLPIFVELIGNKPINEIFQTDINNFFDEVQNLPVTGQLNSRFYREFVPPSGRYYPLKIH